MRESNRPDINKLKENIGLFHETTLIKIKNFIKKNFRMNTFENVFGFIPLGEKRCQLSKDNFSIIVNHLDIAYDQYIQSITYLNCTYFEKKGSEVYNAILAYDSNKSDKAIAKICNILDFNNDNNEDRRLFVYYIKLFMYIYLDNNFKISKLGKGFGGTIIRGCERCGKCGKYKL